MGDQTMNLQISKERLNEIHTNRLINEIAKLHLEVSQLTAVNEAMVEKLREYSESSAHGPSLIREDSHVSPVQAPGS